MLLGSESMFRGRDTQILESNTREGRKRRSGGRYWLFYGSVTRKPIKMLFPKKKQIYTFTSKRAKVILLENGHDQI